MSVDKNNLAAIRHAYANTVFSHKVQEKAVERKERVTTCFKFLHIFLTACVLGLLVAQTIVSNNPIFSYVGAGITAAEIVLLIVHLSVGADREIATHKNTALKYLNLRDRFKSLIADVISGNLSTEEAIKLRDLFMGEYQMISEMALQTNAKDYDKAMSSLKLEEDNQNVWSDKQIDSLLPKQLRLKQ